MDNLYSLPPLLSQTLNLLGRFSVRIPSLMIRPFLLRPLPYPCKSFHRAFLKTGKASLLKTPKGKIKLWTWNEQKPLVLFSHGWSGRGVQFWKMAQALIDQNFGVILFDHYGHGKSQGQFTTIFDFIETHQALIDRYDNVEYFIGHSLGALTGSLVLEESLSVKKVVYISPAIGLDEMTHFYFSNASLDAEIYQQLRKDVQRKYKFEWQHYSLRHLKKQNRRPTLVLHDRGDQEVDFKAVQEIVKDWPLTNFQLSEGLGHYRILRDREIIKKVTHFLDS